MEVPKPNSISVKRSSNWVPDEDACLISLVDQYGPHKWNLIAAEMGNRNGKQCRERWHNHLDTSIKKEPWSVEEDIILFKVTSIMHNDLLISCNQKVVNIT